MNLSVLVIEAVLLAPTRLQRVCCSHQSDSLNSLPPIRFAIACVQTSARRGVTLLLGIFGERLTGGTGTSFSVPQPSSCVLHSVLLPSLIDRFRTLPSVSRCCQPISDASACVRILDCKRGECGARDQHALLVLITDF